MKLYRAEQDIKTIIESNNKIEFQCSVELLEPPVTLSENLVTAAKKYDFPITDDVLPFSSILVSNIWNKNSVVFTAGELIKFYQTSEFKPVNWMHKGSETRGNQIIGVMLKSDLVKGTIPSFSSFQEEDYVILSSSENRERADGKIHIQSDGIIWSAYFPSYSKLVQKGFKNGTLFVSMEALFTDYDYAFRESADSPIQIVSRNEKTAHYSKALKMFGGKGQANYNGKNMEIAVVPREFVFSGNGFVTNPANNDGEKNLSIIVDVGENSKEISNTVYNINESLNLSNKNDMSTELQNQLTELQSKYDQLVAAHDVATKKVAQLQENELKASLDVAVADKAKVEADLVEANTKIASLEAKIKETESINTKVTELEAKVAEITDAKAKLDAEMAEIRANEEAKTRLADLKSIAGDKYVDADLAVVKAWSKDTFEAVKASLIKAGVSSQAKLTDQSVSGQAKLTDQTVSGQTKLTQASDEDKYVETAAAAVKDTKTVEVATVTPETVAKDENTKVDITLAASRLLCSQIFTKDGYKTNSKSKK
jgi:hypothetical protein